MTVVSVVSAGTGGVGRHDGVSGDGGVSIIGPASGWVTVAPGGVHGRRRDQRVPVVLVVMAARSVTAAVTVVPAGSATPRPVVTAGSAAPAVPGHREQ